MRTVYAFFENNKPAKYPDHKVHPSWKNNEFATLEECQKYATKWMGVYGDVSLLPGHPVMVYNVPFEIRTITKE
jgi:hypothetical protein